MRAPTLESVAKLYLPASMVLNRDARQRMRDLRGEQAARRQADDFVAKWDARELRAIKLVGAELFGDARSPWPTVRGPHHCYGGVVEVDESNPDQLTLAYFADPPMKGDGMARRRVVLFRFRSHRELLEQVKLFQAVA